MVVITKMIINASDASRLAEELIKKFAEDHKEALENNQKNGDSLGVFSGIPLSDKLDTLRNEYLTQVSSEIGNNMNYFNMAIVYYILNRGK